MPNTPLHELELSPEEYERYVKVCSISKMDCSKEEVYAKRRQSKRKSEQDLEQTDPNLVNHDVRASDSYKKWYQNNKESRAAYHARWYQNNKERLREKFKADYQKNKARILAKKNQKKQNRKPKMNVSILSKSQNCYTGSVITTFLLEGFPWRLLCELNTHRQITKNAESSRARPTHNVIEQVLADPYIPIWTKAQKGMQGEVISNTEEFDSHWLNYRNVAVSSAQSAIDMGLHKQDANSYLHPFMRVSVILTATHENWLNFFRLRAHEDAKPCFQLWAYKMQNVYNTVEPSVKVVHKVFPHLSMLANCGKIATVSYAKHAEDRTEKSLEELALKMINSNPVHISPFQHCAYAVNQVGILFLDKDKVYLVNDYHDNAATFAQERSVCDAARISTSNYKNWVPLKKVVKDLF